MLRLCSIPIAYHVLRESERTSIELLRRRRIHFAPCSLDQRRRTRQRQGLVRRWEHTNANRVVQSMMRVLEWVLV